MDIKAFFKMLAVVIAVALLILFAAWIIDRNDNSQRVQDAIDRAHLTAEPRYAED